MTKRSHTVKNDDKLPVRQSIFLWVVGAIISWVLVVVTVYSALRFSDTPGVPPRTELEATTEDEGNRLNRIAPAAGGDQYPVPAEGRLESDEPNNTFERLRAEPLPQDGAQETDGAPEEP